MSRIYLSENANPILKDYLKRSGHELAAVKSTPYVCDFVSTHPDMYMCKMGVASVSPVLHCDPETLGFEYPKDIAWNAVCMGKYFIHNLGYTARELYQEAENLQMEMIYVAQGYTKCNMVIVNENAAITSDKGIAGALESTDIDLLLISPGHVALEGFPHGFLGGASGKIGDEVVFHGALNTHPDFDAIARFIAKHKCRLTYFKEFELEDIGSIIEASY